MSGIGDKLIVALDVPTLKEAKHFVDILYPQVTMFKVGSQLFTACGPEAVKTIARKGGKVFLDLKFHDIPNTVYLCVGTATALDTAFTPYLKEDGITDKIKNNISAPIFMMTVHTKGGLDMLRVAVRGATEKAKDLRIAKPFIVGVTRLTSDEDKGDIQGEVLEAARLAKEADLDGVVCSPREAAMIRKEFGKNFLIVTPGIRPKGAKTDDQKRVATAEEAIAAGADYLVVGRPILDAQNPLKAVSELL